jgi:O-antigen ligase
VSDLDAAEPIEFVSRGQVRPASGAERAAQPASGGVNRAQHRLNGVLAVALVVIVALAPLLLGSNRPVFWMGWTVLFAGLGVAYGFGVLWANGAARVTLVSFWPEATLMAVLLAFQLFQLAPIGEWLPLPAAAGATGNAFATLDQGSTYLTLLATAGLMLFFFLFAQVSSNRRRARRILLALFLVVAAYAILGLVSLTQWNDTLLGFEKQYYRGVATASFVNRNSYATFLASGLAIGAPLLVSAVVGDQGGTIGRRVLMPLLLLVGMGFIAAALFATGSRMGTFAGVAGAVLGLLGGALTFRGSVLGKLLVALAVVAAAVTLVLVFGSGLIERLVFQHGDPGRETLYAQTWAAITGRPLLGYGAGSFAATFPAFQSPPLDGGSIWSHAHSTYLALWYEHGLLFGSLPLLAIALLLGRCLLALRDPSSTMLSLATLGVGFVFAVHSLVDFSAEIYADALLLVAMLALGAVGARNGHRPGST